MPPTTSNALLRQLSVPAGNPSSSLTSSSRRWLGFDSSSSSSHLHRMEGLDSFQGGCGLVVRKRVMVVVDPSSHSRHAMIWALSHVANKGDFLTLLHVLPAPHDRSSSSSSATHLANSLGSLCKACKPEVEVEALVIQGPRMATVMSQVKKLDVSVLVLGQKRRSHLLHCLCGGRSVGEWEEFVEECIEGADCLTIGVRKQSSGVGGYLISTRWQKDFWLLA